MGLHFDLQVGELSLLFICRCAVIKMTNLNSNKCFKLDILLYLNLKRLRDALQGRRISILYKSLIHRKKCKILYSCIVGVAGLILLILLIDEE